MTGPSPRPLEERFWEKVDRRRQNECWHWLGTMNKGTGYGCIRVGSMKDGTRRNVDAHRLSCEMAHGPIPKGMFAAHHCDDRRCVNPAHLYIATPAQNTADMQERNPFKRVCLTGERHPNSKLTLEQVLAIKLSAERPSVLARRYGITMTHVGYLRSGKSWRHVDGH